MNVTIGSIGEWLTGLGALSLALIAIGTLFRYTILVPLKKYIGSHFAPLQEEMKTTVEDAIDRVESSTSNLRNEMAILSARMDDHIANCAPAATPPAGRRKVLW